jgi:hypothetical protein
MEKEFIPYDEALALKELGFDEPCFGFFKTNKEFEQYHRWYKGKFLGCTNKILSRILDGENVNSKVLSPTFSQAFRWFRGAYNISHSIDWMSRSSGFHNGYYVHFRGVNGNKINENNFIVLNDELPPEGYGVYKTYEEAEFACLKKLIEVVKIIK